MKGAEAQEDRIDAQEPQVGHPGAAHDHQAHHGEQNPDEAVIALVTVTPHRLLDAPAKVESREKAADQLQAPVRRDPLLGEGDRKILDPSANRPFRYPHNRDPPVLCGEACNSIHNTDGVTFNPSSDRVRLFSD